MSRHHHHGLILAGGRGTRFWPRSRSAAPKQLQPILTGRTMLRETVDRLKSVLPPERVWILTGEALRGRIVRDFPDIPARQILAEPAPRNTGPCIGLAAQVLHQIDPDAVMGVFPADHHIARPAAFRRLARAAWAGAEKGHLLVIGIPPRWAETGYGYVEFPPGTQPGRMEPQPVLRFREKPDLRTARRFLAAKRFFWNSGMFFWRAGVFLEVFRRHLPRTASLLSSLPPLASRRFTARLREVFPLVEKISVDYAILEKAPGVMGLAAGDIGWNDVGSWNAVYELLAGARGHNVLRTDSLLISSRGNLVDAPGKLVALLGVDDLVVVDTPDALLVADRSRAQQVGDVVSLLEKLERGDLL